jgi:hypothetical protein
MCGALLASLFFLGMGALMVFQKDIVWDLTEWNHRRQGIVETERTPEWEASQTLWGAILMILGAVFTVIVLTQ